MTIRVRFFAAARERAGTSMIEIDAGTASTVSELIVRLARERGADLASALAAPGMRFAVNQELVESDAAIRDGDEVAFMPPVTGG
jgi:molybdopterin converting factor subunit 1